jgi:hypothetical protein
VDEFAKGAIARCVENYLRITPRPHGVWEYENKMPRGAGSLLS